MPISDHPRRCGENGVKCCKMRLYVGSPPQVRGKHLFKKFGKHIQGITPAGAGKTPCWLSRWAVCRDHPRRCGENMPSGCGSAVSVRITPAGAGKTALAVADGVPATDHPRRCGENSFFVQRPQSSNWITPAGAGKTHRLNGAQCIIRDHPSRCGEN